MDLAFLEMISSSLLLAVFRTVPSALEILRGTEQFESKVKESLIGFHAFTGNDYVSSFYRKGKGGCWSALEKIQDFCQPSKIWDQPGNLQKKNSSYLKITYVCYTVVERRT